MKSALGTLLCLIVGGGGAFADATVGQPAPDFNVTAVSGQMVNLKAQRGKYVVLEWTNPQCPYVKKQYEPGTMQALQKKWTGEGVVWVTVCSSAVGREGYSTADQVKETLQQQKSSPSFFVIDQDGQLGHSYGARTTPHMFVIDPTGKLIYAGAIDDKAKTNYVDQALTEARAGKAVSQAETQPYGCSVKYKQ